MLQALTPRTRCRIVTTAAIIFLGKNEYEALDEEDQVEVVVLFCLEHALMNTFVSNMPKFGNFEVLSSSSPLIRAESHRSSLEYILWPWPKGTPSGFTHIFGLFWLLSTSIFLSGLCFWRIAGKSGDPVEGFAAPAFG